MPDAFRPPTKSMRPVHWNATGAALTPVFDAASLTPGAFIEGPAIVESPITNYVIAFGWRLTVDEQINYWVEQQLN